MRLTKIFYVTTCVLGLFPLLKLNHFSILMMIWLVLAMVNAVNNETFSTLKKHIYPFVILSFFCLMYVVYLPFTVDFLEFGKSIVNSLHFFVFSLCFFRNSD